MTKMDFVKMELAFNKDYTKYHTFKTIEYKYRGEFRTRREVVMTEEGEKLKKILSEESKKHFFTCPCCGEKVHFEELEIWTSDELKDVIENKTICSICYEEEMGEDL